ncbi:MAG: hypothetical protein CR979_02935 [Propionibacterium sp.]|nr:MAG: hypothetical protein CR979_02935 [Propionibacterium sp.]
MTSVAIQLSPGLKSDPIEIRSDEGMRILSYLLAGLLFYGGLGYVGSVVFEAVWLIPVGIILGIALSIYTIIKRFGSVE